MKGISAVIASILMLMITIAISGTAYLYVSGVFGSRTSVLLVIDQQSSCSGSTLNVYVRNDGSNVASNVNIDIKYPNATTFTSQCSISRISAGTANLTACSISSPPIVGFYQVKATGGGSAAIGSIYCSSGVSGGGGSTATTSTTTTTAGCGSPPAGATAYWSFNENAGTNAADSINSDNNITLGTNVNWAPGGSCKAGTCLSVATGGSTTSAAWSGDIGTSSTYTFAGWFYFSDFGASYADIYYKGTTGEEIYLDEVSGGCSASAPCLAWALAGVCTSATFSTGHWYFIAVTYDGSNVIYYLNGVPECTIPHAGAPGPGTSFYVFSNSGGSYKWNGYSDEVRVYQRALSQPEVNQLYVCP